MVTFSRSAATEFKKRLLKLIGNAAHYIEIKTFHSYCFDLLGGLTDRGRVAPGVLADLLLVHGDPLTNIADTLSIRAVWHRGVQLTPQG